MPKKPSDSDRLTDAAKAAKRARNAENRARRDANAALRDARKGKSQTNAKAPKAGKSDAKPASDAPIPAAIRDPRPVAVPIPSPPATAQEYLPEAGHFNILLIVQAGKLENEALLFVESLRQNAPEWRGRLILAEPRPEAAWAGHEVQISAPARAILESRGAEIVPFTAQHFGAAYPYGNKIEALSVLPPDQNFIFFDSDTLITGPLDQMEIDFARPSASMRREATWPLPPLYGPEYSGIWRSLYDRFGLDFDSSLDLTQPDEHWERFLYFNAGWFFGNDPAEFGRRFLSLALAVRDAPGDALASQEMDPWLDQIVLPLVIHSLGGGRPGPALDGFDGAMTCHWRKLPLLYARESDAAVDALERAAAAPDIQALLLGWEPALRLIYQRNGRDALRPAIDRSRLPVQEQPLRQQIKRAGWWVV